MTAWMKAFVRIIPTIMIVPDYLSVVNFVVSLGLGDALVVFISEALFYKLQWPVVFQVVWSSGLGWVHALFGLSMLYFHRQSIAGAHSIILNDKYPDQVYAESFFESTGTRSPVVNDNGIAVF